MSAVGYRTTTEGAVSLSAATAKSILGVKAHANSGLQVKGFKVGAKGVTASNVPGVIELCYSTFGANSPGTNSTSTTIRQLYGRVLTAGFTGGRNWTTEPTTLTVIEEFPLTPNGGLVIIPFPLGTEPDCALAEGFVLRLTFPDAVNVHASMDVERI